MSCRQTERRVWIIFGKCASLLELKTPQPYWQRSKQHKIKKNEKGRIQKRGGRKIKQETLIHNGAGVSSPIAAAVGEQQKLEINIINNLFVCEIHNVTDTKDHYKRSTEILIVKTLSQRKSKSANTTRINTDSLVFHPGV